VLDPDGDWTTIAKLCPTPRLTPAAVKVPLDAGCPSTDTVVFEGATTETVTGALALQRLT
jgi:hypothetical protein